MNDLRAPSALSRMPIVIVDDDALVVRVLSQRFKDAGFCHVYGLTDPLHAESLIQRVGADLVILDVHMPGMDGLQLLRALNRSAPGVPVLMLTSDKDLEIRHRAFERGAREFLSKTADRTESFLRVVNLLEIRALQLELHEQNETLESRVHERTAELDASRIEVLERLALAAEFRDDETQQHAMRIGRSSALIASALGLDDSCVHDIRRAAALHDVGKIGIPDAILLKPGKLDHREWAIMKTHTTVGARILSGSSSELLRLAQEIALNHHERWDGTGYPNRLSGVNIPLSGRIVAVADVFDALAHVRPYKEAWSVDESVAEIVRQAGHQFDPQVVAAFQSLDPACLQEQAARVPFAQTGS